MNTTSYKSSAHYIARGHDNTKYNQTIMYTFGDTYRQAPIS